MDKKVIDRLKHIVGVDGVLSTPEDLVAYSFDSTFMENLPDVVVLPTSTEQVSEMIKLGAETRTPIIPRASGIPP